MKSITVEYKLYGSPPIHHITLFPEDLAGCASVLQFITGWHNYPDAAEAEIYIIDILPNF